MLDDKLHIAKMENISLCVNRYSALRSAFGYFFLTRPQDCNDNRDCAFATTGRDY